MLLVGYVLSINIVQQHVMVKYETVDLLPDYLRNDLCGRRRVGGSLNLLKPTGYVMHQQV
jgi:hypothetical protein